MATNKLLKYPEDFSYIQKDTAEEIHIKEIQNMIDHFTDLVNEYIDDIQDRLWERCSGINIPINKIEFNLFSYIFNRLVVFMPYLCEARYPGLYIQPFLVFLYLAA